MEAIRLLWRRGTLASRLDLFAGYSVWCIALGFEPSAVHSNAVAALDLLI